jgi:hypothetical protein
MNPLHAVARLLRFEERRTYADGGVFAHRGKRFANRK